MRRRLYSILLVMIVLYGCGEDNSAAEKPDTNEAGVSDNGCGWADGTYSATVDYYNPGTEFSNTYTLDVEVEDCQVIQINFPNGGWLDEDHISPADIDEDGEAEIDGEGGKTYTVHLERGG